MSKVQIEANIVKFLDIIPYGIFFFDSEWRFTYSNMEASKVFPFEKKYAYGKNVWELFPATVGTILEKQFRASIKTQKKHRLFSALHLGESTLLNAILFLQVWEFSLKTLL